MQEEQWRPVIGFEGKYAVSSKGRVCSLAGFGRVKDKILKTNRVGKGKHHIVRLRKDGRYHNRMVHRIMLEAFVGPCPPNHQGLHWDDDSDNNTLPNLRWGTASENMRDKVRNGRHHNAVKTHCKQGHEYTDANTYRPKTGGRMCKTCLRVRGKQHMRKVRAAAKS